MIIGQIIKGWANVLLDKFDLLDPEIKEMAETRLKTCHLCPMRSRSACSTVRKNEAVKDFYYAAAKEERKKGELYSGCGCNIAAKTTVTLSQCPLGKW